MIDNLPRVLPKDCDAAIDTCSWRVPTIFELIAKNGKVDREEMYQVFNMGVGMAVIVSSRNAAQLAKSLRARTVGRIENGSGVTRLLF